MTAIQPQREGDGSLVHVVNALLDKGLVINADIMVSVAGVELLGIRIRAALASFDTAAQYGLEFPAGTDTSTVAWQQSLVRSEACPHCGKRVPADELLHDSCPWCGWQSARALAVQERQEQAGQLPTSAGETTSEGARAVGSDTARTDE